MKFFNDDSVSSTDSVGSFCGIFLACFIVIALVVYFTKESSSGIGFLES